MTLMNRIGTDFKPCSFFPGLPALALATGCALQSKGTDEAPQSDHSRPALACWRMMAQNPVLRNSCSPGFIFSRIHGRTNSRFLPVNAGNKQRQRFSSAL